MHGRPSEEVGPRGPRGHAPGVRSRGPRGRPGRRPPSDPPQRQAGREPRGVGEGAGRGASLRQGASEVPGSGIESGRAVNALIFSDRHKNHSFGGCDASTWRRKVSQDRARSPLPGTRDPALLPVGSGLRYLPPPYQPDPPLLAWPRRHAPSGRRPEAVVEKARGQGSLKEKGCKRPPDVTVHQLSARENVFRTRSPSIVIGSLQGRYVHPLDYAL